MDEILLHASFAGQLRAHVVGDNVTIERRDAEGPWTALTYGDLVHLGAKGGAVAHWLVGVGVPHDGWTGNTFRAIARFKIG
jgi:hypothetical protein